MNRSENNMESQLLAKSKKKRILYCLCVFVLSTCLNLATSCSSYAALDALVKYASPEGGMSNVNSAAIIKDQSGGYMTGGSILLRGPKPKELEPINIQTPRLRFDACTGSGDFRFGAMSYISAAEFSQFLKGVGRASGAYLVKMSIKTACPQCEDIMSNLEAIARDINGLTMNQCSMAQNIASGAFGKLASGEKQQCMMESNVARTNSDMFETTRRCQDTAGDVIRGPSDEFESMLGDEFNLVWKALSKPGIAATDTKLKELMMSVSGTIIGKKEGGRYRFFPKPTLLRDKDLLEKYIGGSSGSSRIQLYVCDSTDKCLDPRLEEVTLGPTDTLYGNISKIMKSLIEKVKVDNPTLTEDEEALLAFSSVPILNLIEMELATKTNTDDYLVRMSEFVEVVCYDVITNFLQAMLNRVITNVQALEHVQVDNVVIKSFVVTAENIRRFLSDAKFGAFQKLQIITQVKQRLELQHKEFEFTFGKMMQHLEN